ncbi:spore germination protein [Cohnella cholangitidis]|uniref:Spore germination protein n=1 Tax=Cohnella cholangitidis TaxID=2598458 RepID=A0A7G5BY45_9BACL|nr:spore germination protein [Cohnella cholangitidis]QMV41879.1 spore germination protein [Cohnella cholangitidis]
MSDRTSGENEIKSGPQPFVFDNLQENIGYLQRMLHTPSDLVTRVLTVGGGPRMCAVICIDGLSDKQFIHEQIIYNLQHDRETIREQTTDSGEKSDILTELSKGILAAHQISRTEKWHEIIDGVLSGNTVLFIEGEDRALLIGTQMWAGRSVEEPPTEALVRGPREGFTEEIATNIALVRKGIRDINLLFDTYTIGRRSRKSLVLAYIQGVMHPDLVEEVKRRLASLDIDDAPESGTVEQWIEDSFLSPFPQILHTERPDKVRAALLQGKAAILLDGTPFVLLLPTTFVSLIQSPEDYYERWIIGSLIRLLRYLAVFISLFFPALYVALVSFHQGMIPFKLAFSIAAAREGVPFPALIEALLMEGTLELLREAGVRLPKPIGQTIGIVGGLVIGEAAVKAGVVSPIMVIVVAVTAIASFAIPSYSAGIAFRILRFGIILAASVLGLFGIILAFIMISLHLVRLTSFGIPYSAPFAPLFAHDWRDLLIRAPITFLTKRPEYMQTKNVNRANKRGNGS